MKKAVWMLILLVGALHAADGRWQKIGPRTGTIRQIVPDRNHVGLWFAVDEERYGAQRLYRSTDFGKSWSRTSLQQVTRVAVHPETTEVFAIVQNTQLWASKDRGVHFVRRNSTNVTLYKIVPDPSGCCTPPTLNCCRLYAIGYLRQAESSSGVLVSEDDGRTWGELGGLPALPADCDETECEYAFQDLLVSPFNADTLFLSGSIYDAFADPPIKYGDVFLTSTDGGHSWKKLQNTSYSFYTDRLFPFLAFAFNKQGLLMLNESTGFQRLSRTPLRELAIVPHQPGQTNLMVGLQECLECPESLSSYQHPSKLVRSTDGGRTWSADSNDLNHAITHIGTIERYGSEKNELMAGTDGGGVLLRSTAGNWSPATGFLEPDISDVETIGNGLVYSLSGQRWIFTSRNAGGSWKPQTSPAFVFLYMNPRNPLNLLGNARTVSTPLLYSEDGGITWKNSAGLANQGNYSHLAFDPIQSNIIYVALEPFSTIYKSTNSGRSFQPLPIQFPDSVYGINRIIVDERDDNIVYFLTWSGGIFKSTNGGKSAHAVNCGLPCTNCAPSPYDMAPLLHKDSYLLLISDGSVFRTDNGGEQWRRVGQMDAYFANRLVAADAIGQRFFAIGNQFDNQEQLFESTDDGKTWHNITPELGNKVEVNDITDARSSKFYIATNRGVFTNR